MAGSPPKASPSEDRGEVRPGAATHPRRSPHSRGPARCPAHHGVGHGGVLPAGDDYPWRAVTAEGHYLRRCPGAPGKGRSRSVSGAVTHGSPEPSAQTHCLRLAPCRGRVLTDSGWDAPTRLESPATKKRVNRAQNPLKVTACLESVLVTSVVAVVPVTVMLPVSTLASGGRTRPSGTPRSLPRETGPRHPLGPHGGPASHPATLLGFLPSFDGQYPLPSPPTKRAVVFRWGPGVAPPHPPVCPSVLTHSSFTRETNPSGPVPGVFYQSLLSLPQWAARGPQVRALPEQRSRKCGRSAHSRK